MDDFVTLFPELFINESLITFLTRTRIITDSPRAFRLNFELFIQLIRVAIILIDPGRPVPPALRTLGSPDTPAMSPRIPPSASPSPTGVVKFIEFLGLLF